MKKDLLTILHHTNEVGNCREWSRCFNTDGYPRAVINGNVNAKVHRVVWELYNGKSAEGLVVRHTCDNIRCINPAHLEIGSPKDNARDRYIRGRNAKTRNVPTMGQVAELAQRTDEGTTALVKATGFSKNVIKRIKSGKPYRGLTISKES